jgi:HK97 family phage major capsid protein
MQKERMIESMNNSKAMKDLQTKLHTAQTDAVVLQNKTDATADEVTAAMDGIKVLKAKITTQEALDDGKVFDDKGDGVQEKPKNEPVYPEPKNHEPLKLFKNFGEQLRAVKNTAKGVYDERLLKLNNAAAGMSEGSPSEGGFAVQTDFAGAIMESAAKAGNILPLVDRYEVGAGSNAVRWMDIDESSVATTVFGGVQVYWAAEAAEVTAKKPKLMERSLELKKLMGIAYATYELEQDANFTGNLFMRAFQLAIQRKLEGDIVAGDGAAGMLGITKSGALVSIDKESGQAADTILWKNISKMYNRSLNKSTSAWLMHPDCADQLDFMQFPVGTGGVPVYLPAALAGSV